MFLHEVLDLTGMEISFGVLPAHTSIPFYHRHQQNEEVHLFLKGEGQFQIDGQVLEVSEGTAILVSPEGVRTCRNTSAEDLFYIVIQAKAGSLEQWTGSDGVAVPGPVAGSGPELPVTDIALRPSLPQPLHAGFCRLRVVHSEIAQRRQRFQVP